MDPFFKNIRPLSFPKDLESKSIWNKIKENYSNISYYLRWECSIAYKLFEMIPRPIIRFFSKLNTLWYARIVNRHWIIKTNLPKNIAWHSAQKRMLYANMNLFKEWYETEAQTTEWNGYETLIKAKIEFDTIYEWWKSYPNKE